MTLGDETRKNSADIQYLRVVVDEMLEDVMKIKRRLLALRQENKVLKKELKKHE